ncbi:hypothetical protein GOP47_0029693 [Adiantum capillus-veneris]|nr:hypothetical protein GOP47_0029693 [Adiantum capillus-veneris]
MNDLLSRSFHGSSADLEAGSLELGAQGLQMSGDNQLARFHAEVAILDSEMEKVRDLLKKLKQTNEESLTVTSAQAMKALRERMDNLIVDVLHKAKFIKSKLEALDMANLESRKILGCEEGTTIDRIRSNITNKQRVMLGELMESFDKLREQMRSEYRKTIKRRYFTITGEKASKETIDQMIETGESETFLQKAVQEQGRGHILNTIEEIQERHDTVKEIEKNLLELHQIFMDMAVLVDAQGIQLTTIQEAVVATRSFIERGTKRLTSTRKLQKNARKWTCIGILILAIIIIIAIVLLVNLLK